MNSYEGPEEPFGASELRKGLKRRLKETKLSYNQILNKLWVSNGAGAAASLSEVNFMLKNHKPHDLFMWPLSLFMIGLMFLFIGSIITLILDSMTIKYMESVKSIIDVNLDLFRKPSKKAGLTLSDWQTVMAICAAVSLILGVIVGFCVLL